MESRRGSSSMGWGAINKEQTYTVGLSGRAVESNSGWASQPPSQLPPSGFPSQSTSKGSESREAHDAVPSVQTLA